MIKKLFNSSSALKSITLEESSAIFYVFTRVKMFEKRDFYFILRGYSQIFNKPAVTELNAYMKDHLFLFANLSEVSFPLSY